MLRFSSLLFLCIWITAIANAQERYAFSNLSLEDGLSQITVLCTIQDQEGYMWFGTRNGLNRYDGYGFDVFISEADDHSTISDNHILCLAKDDRGNLWIGTNNGLNRLEISTRKFTRYLSPVGDSSPSGRNVISALFHDEEGNLWVGTRNGLYSLDMGGGTLIRVDVGGLLEGVPINAIARHGDQLYLGTYSEGLIVYDIKTRSFEEYKQDPSDEGSIPHNYVRAVLVDNEGNLWLGTHHEGVCYRKKGEDKFRIVNTLSGLSNNYIRVITQSPAGDIVVGTFNGLNVIDPRTGNIARYDTYGGGQGNLSHYSVFSTYFDRSGTLWVGTYSGGVDFSNKYVQQFRHYNPSMYLENYYGILGTMLETEECVYFASEGMGLLEWNKDRSTFRTYNPTAPQAGRAAPPTIIKSIYRNGSGELLCGTNVGTVYSFDMQKKTFRMFHDTRIEDPIYYIGRNGRGELILGGVSEPVGLRVIAGNGSVTEYFPLDNGRYQAFPNVRCVLEISPDRYLIGTRNEGLYDFHVPGRRLSHYKNDGAGAECSIPDNYVTAIHRDSGGRTWIGTFGGGISLFDIESGCFTTYTTADGLLDDNVCSVVDGPEGHLWISTISGISDFDTHAGTFANYTHRNGIGISEFTPHSGAMLSDGRIVFSGNNGFVAFDPGFMYSNPYIPPVVLRNLYIDNERIVPGDGTGILSRTLSDEREIILRHDQTNISIEYSALNYIFPEQNHYAYRLEGFDAGWNEVGTRRMAYYTNIPPGSYRFRVKGSNNDGYWNEEGASVTLTILPPFWRTWWAYFGYIIFGAGVVWFVVRYFTERRRLENDIKLKQAESRAQAEFHEARDKLFTNFSHELRTPLTLIMSPLDDMIEREGTFSDPVRNNLESMQSNAKRLLRLVNNLMDFQKRQSGKLTLNVSEGDFIGFSRVMTEAFGDMARSRDILLEYRHNVDMLKWKFDRNLMEKVFFNFLSNAFKNVPNGGNVEVSVSVLDKVQAAGIAGKRFVTIDGDNSPFLLLEISDSGSGIAAEELERIFDPFYQVSQNEHSASGTGLGLSLSKAIVEMHYGIIWAESPPETGAVFRVLIPVSRTADMETSSQRTTPDTEKAVVHSPAVPAVTPLAEAEELPGEPKKYTVLVVEDNSEVRRYIVSHVETRYNVIEAVNGQEGMDKAVMRLPDLVITDLMMPKMDGMEMVRRIKQDIRTSHVPVIVITARAMNSDMVEGYEAGADDYIVKPFNSSLLMARIRNIIQARENLKNIYGKRFDLDSLGVQVTSVDELFMNKLYDVLEKNYSDPEFNLDAFSKDIGMSRANLYRKIKAITDLSPNEMLRNFRLETGAKMLAEARMPVSDVYVAVGFGSHAYFSNCFRNLYGISPTEYAAKNKK